MAPAAATSLFVALFVNSCLVCLVTPADQLTCPSKWKNGEKQTLKCVIQVSNYTGETCTRDFSDLVDFQFTPPGSDSPSSECVVHNVTQSCDGTVMPPGCQCKEKTEGAYILEFIVKIDRSRHENGTWSCVPACATAGSLHNPYDGLKSLECGPVITDSGPSISPNLGTMTILLAVGVLVSGIHGLPATQW